MAKAFAAGQEVAKPFQLRTTKIPGDVAWGGGWVEILVSALPSVSA